MFPCLRNGQKIVEVAQTDENRTGLNCFAYQVEVKSNVNDGLLHQMPFIYPNLIKALQEAFKDQNPKNIFIIMNDEGLKMSNLEEAIPDHCFVNFQDKEAMRKWLESSNTNQHLVLQGNLYDSKVNGMEFQSMMYVFPICLKCGDEDKKSSVITRAKASLVIANYENQDCIKCDDENYPDLKWNEDCKKWEIEQGITIDQLQKESRKIFEKTSKLYTIR